LLGRAATLAEGLVHLPRAHHSPHIHYKNHGDLQKQQWAEHIRTGDGTRKEPRGRGHLPEFRE
jgi:hypothetical protein